MNRTTLILCTEKVVKIIQTLGGLMHTQHCYDHSYSVWPADYKPLRAETRVKGSEASKLQASGVEAPTFLLLSHN